MKRGGDLHPAIPEAADESEELDPLPIDEVRPRIYTNRQDASTTLAMRYQTSQLTLMTFPKWTWTTAFELPLAKTFDMPLH